MKGIDARIPAAVVERLGGVFGERARAFAERLPALLAELAARWELALEPPFPALSYHYVAPARRRGEPVVLKVGVPHRELRCEIAALRAFGGRGAARLLEADARAGALLLERLEPGTPLALEEEDGVWAIAARVARRLRRPPPSAHAFPTLERWALAFRRLRARSGGGTGPLPAALVERAEALFRELSASTESPALLHGDLHHWNVLRAGREPWLAIDPQGVVGDPAYEVGSLIRNAVARSADPARTLARGVDRLGEELGLERERLAAWTFAHAVLSAVWSAESGSANIPAALRCAELAAARLHGGS